MLFAFNKYTFKVLNALICIMSVTFISCFNTSKAVLRGWSCRAHVTFFQLSPTTIPYLRLYDDCLYTNGQHREREKD